MRQRREHGTGPASMEGRKVVMSPHKTHAPLVRALRTGRSPFTAEMPQGRGSEPLFNSCYSLLISSNPMAFGAISMLTRPAQTFLVNSRQVSPTTYSTPPLWTWGREMANKHLKLAMPPKSASFSSRRTVHPTVTLSVNVSGCSGHQTWGHP